MKAAKSTEPELWAIEPEHDRFAVAIGGRVIFCGSEEACRTRLDLMAPGDDDREGRNRMLRRAITALAFLCMIGTAWGEELPILPDDVLTPGVVASTDETEVCATGPNGTYSQQHRQTSEAMKREVYQRYGVVQAGREFEIDHRLPLALGGKDDVLNLWPQQGWQHPSFHDKDRLESYLWRQVCKAHAMPLGAAQKLLLGDWPTAFKQVFGVEPM